MTYRSFCSGIEAPSLAWQPLGWRALSFSEIEPFACAVLAHHYPDVPNYGDMEKITDGQITGERASVFVAGTPCQSFSVAGLRKGLADPRGNLALEYLALADAARPEWLVWENVPGVLSSWSDAASFAPSEEYARLLREDGLDPGDFEEVEQTNDFDQFTAGVRELGYSLAWGILDAQYFDVAQRRKRVFLVANLGSWTRAAAVLFDRQSLSGNPAPSREAGERVAGCFTQGAHPGGYNGQDAYAGHLISHSLRADGFDASEDGTGRGDTAYALDGANGQAVAYGIDSDALDRTGEGANGTAAERAGLGIVEELSPACRAKRPNAVAYQCQGTNVGPMGALRKGNGNETGGVPFVFQTRVGRNGRGQPKEIADALTSCEGGTHADSKPHVAGSFGVRRLTPTECERLMAVPDGFTAVPYRGKPAADGPRYRVLGNSIVTTCLRWIGERIDAVELIGGAA